MITQPRQITTKPIKKGPAIDGVMLSKTASYNAVGEPFKDVGRAIAFRKQDNEKIAAAGHEKAFSPSKIVKLSYKAPYEHQAERVNVVKNFKDEEGNVIVQPRNFQTSPPKVGLVGKNTTFGGPTPWLKDDYDHPKVLAQKEREYHLSKRQDKPFSQRAKTLNNGVFNQPKGIYDIK